MMHPGTYLRPALRLVRAEGCRSCRLADLSIISWAPDMDRHTLRQTLIGVAIMILALIAVGLVLGLLLGP
jgi:hypothetical protein